MSPRFPKRAVEIPDLPPLPSDTPEDALDRIEELLASIDRRLELMLLARQLMGGVTPTVDTTPG